VLREERCYKQEEKASDWQEGIIHSEDRNPGHSIVVYCHQSDCAAINLLQVPALHLEIFDNLLSPFLHIGVLILAWRRLREDVHKASHVFHLWQVPTCSMKQTWQHLYAYNGVHPCLHKRCKLYISACRATTMQW